MITFNMLQGIYNCGVNPLSSFNINASNFVKWAKEEGGCWYWMEDMIRGCIKDRIVHTISYRYNPNREDKWWEYMVLVEFPFINLGREPMLGRTRRHYLALQTLLREEWLRWINQENIVRVRIKVEYDKLTGPLV